MISKVMQSKGKTFVRLAEEGKTFAGAYNQRDETWKDNFKRTGRSVLTALGKELAFDEMKVTYNPGGVAVSGETSLRGIWNNDGFGIHLETHSPALYQLVSADDHPVFMWHTIEAMNDYRGGPNRWLHYLMFNDIEGLARYLEASKL